MTKFTRRAFLTLTQRATSFLLLLTLFTLLGCATWKAKTPEEKAQAIAAIARDAFRTGVAYDLAENPNDASRRVIYSAAKLQLNTFILRKQPTMEELNKIVSSIPIRGSMNATNGTVILAEGGIQFFSTAMNLYLDPTSAPGLIIVAEGIVKGIDEGMARVAAPPASRAKAPIAVRLTVFVHKGKPLPVKSVKNTSWF